MSTHAHFKNKIGIEKAKPRKSQRAHLFTFLAGDQVIAGFYSRYCEERRGRREDHISRIVDQSVFDGLIAKNRSWDMSMEKDGL